MEGGILQNENRVTMMTQKPLREHVRRPYSIFSVACKVTARLISHGVGKRVSYVARLLLPPRRSRNSLPAAGSLHGLLLHAGIRCVRFDVCTSSSKHT